MSQACMANPVKHSRSHSPSQAKRRNSARRIRIRMRIRKRMRMRRRESREKRRRQRQPYPDPGSLWLSHQPSTLSFTQLDSIPLEFSPTIPSSIPHPPSPSHTLSTVRTRTHSYIHPIVVHTSRLSSHVPLNSLTVTQSNSLNSPLRLRLPLPSSPCGGTRTPTLNLNGAHAG